MQALLTELASSVVIADVSACVCKRVGKFTQAYSENLNSLRFCRTVRTRGAKSSILSDTARWYSNAGQVLRIFHGRAMQVIDLGWD